MNNIRVKYWSLLTCPRGGYGLKRRRQERKKLRPGFQVSEVSQSLKTRDYFKLWYIQILCTSSQISRVNVNKNRRPTKKNRTHNLHRMSGRWEGCTDVNTKLERGLMIIVLKTMGNSVTELQNCIELFHISISQNKVVKLSAFL